MYPIVSAVAKRFVQYIDENGKNGETAFKTKEVCHHRLRSSMNFINFLFKFLVDNTLHWRFVVQLFGFDSKAFEDQNIFIKHANHVFETLEHSRFISKVLSFFPFLYNHYKANITNPESNEWFVDMTKKAIETRKRSGTKRDDFLNFLIELQEKEGISIEEFAGHEFTIFLDGYESVSHFLAGGLNLLAKTPEVQKKLREEILTQNEIDLEILHQMTYLDKVTYGNDEANAN